MSRWKLRPYLRAGCRSCASQAFWLAHAWWPMPSGFVLRFQEPPHIFLFTGVRFQAWQRVQHSNRSLEP